MNIPKNILTGIADEAATDLPTQIQVHQELGWKEIELRQIDQKNVTFELTETEFDRAVDLLGEAGLTVTGLASAIGNWSRPISGNFQMDVDELKTAIPRMQKLGVRFIRTMSWTGDGVPEADWKKECLRRYQELVKMAEDGGIILCHENCAGWAGLSAEHSVELFEAIGNKHLAALFDIGNTISHGLHTLDYYHKIKPYIRYVHVKDAQAKAMDEERTQFCLPGEGDAQLQAVLTDLLRSGYDGVISIEPHIASIIHLEGQKNDPEFMRKSYLEYGRAFVALVEEVRNSLR